MNEFVIKTPSADSNCNQSITVSIDDDHIILSDTEYGSQYITIPLDKWQEMKGAIDAVLSARKSKLNKQDIPSNPNTGKPYFKVNENAWDGEWAAGEVKPIPDSEFGGDELCKMTTL